MLTVKPLEGIKSILRSYLKNIVVRFTQEYWNSPRVQPALTTCFAAILYSECKNSIIVPAFTNACWRRPCISTNLRMTCLNCSSLAGRLEQVFRCSWCPEISASPISIHHVVLTWNHSTCLFNGWKNLQHLNTIGTLLQTMEGERTVLWLVITRGCNKHRHNNQSNLPSWQRFPVYPWRHWHMKSFVRSVHVPPFWQGFGEHSSVSESKNRVTPGKTDVLCIWCNSCTKQL